MWLPRRRAQVESLAILVLLALGGVAGAGGLFTGDIRCGVMALLLVPLLLLGARFLLRCENCGKGPLWWALKHEKAMTLAAPLRGVSMCPYCGYSRDSRTIYG
jgi:hypothetical protein